VKRRITLLLSTLLLSLLAGYIGSSAIFNTEGLEPQPSTAQLRMPTPPFGTHAPPSRVLEGNITTPIETDTTFYVLRKNGVGLATEIPIRFQNQTTETLHIVNCNGLLTPVLEKQVGDGWETFWSPVLPACWSLPILMAPGVVHVDTLRVWGALPGHDAGPQFKSDDVEGVFRIVLYNVFFNYHGFPSGFPDLVPLEYRVSNLFFLDDPRR
jgi:hypothetical protein